MLLEKMFKSRLFKGGIFSVLIFIFLLLPLNSLAAEKPAKLSAVQKTMLQNKPGVVFISNYYKVDLIVQSSAGYPELSGKTYTVETGGMGSGFVINPDGYILTNGHVVKTPEKQLVFYAIQSAADSIVKDIARAELVRQYGITPSDQELDTWLPQIIQNIGGKDVLIQNLYQGYQSGELKLDNVNQNVYVQQGAFVSGKKIPMDKGLKADIRVVDFEGFTDEGEAKGKDIAIIKVSASNMPTVKLGDSSKMQVGDKIYVVGYPGVPTFVEFLSKESQLEATMTSGIVSALKTMKDGSQVLQTDAALTHGNSGGPAFNEKGEVIGIASMVAIEQGQQKYGFSYLRPSNVAKEFVNEKNVKNTSGPTDEHYRKGLDYYDSQKYKSAKKEFEAALRLYPNLVEAQDYLKKSQEGIEQGFSWNSLLDVDSNTFVIIVLAIVLIIVGVVLIKVFKKEKSMEKEFAQIKEETGSPATTKTDVSTEKK